MKFFLPVTLSLILNFTAVLLPAQTVEQTAAINLLTEKSNRGDYAIIEVRLNNEDEFKTLEGSSSGLSRIAIFYGKTANDNPILLKGFTGFSDFVVLLNLLQEKGWEIEEVYSLKGQSLIVTHYLIRKVKK
tara:strand:+ start:56800 stop:57192 length:393 start_codon:yes stop_codon:yes gene_type:complete